LTAPIVMVEFMTNPLSPGFPGSWMWFPSIRLAFGLRCQTALRALGPAPSGYVYQYTPAVNGCQ
jgi:hypothetical protein